MSDFDLEALGFALSLPGLSSEVQAAAFSAYRRFQKERSA